MFKCFQKLYIGEKNNYIMMKQFLFLLLNILFLTSFAVGSTVHGTIYDSNLDTVNKVIVEVNSTPLQRHVSKYGGYSFELDSGSYHIVALASSRGDPVVISEEYVLISSDTGDYIVDLFLFPGVNVTEETVSVPFFDLGMILWAVSSVFILIIGVFIFILFKKLNDKKVKIPVAEYNLQYSPSNIVDSSNDPDSDIKSSDVNVTFSSEDDVLKKRILKLVDESGGNMSQKDIRRKIKLSESKISEVISSLVEEGVVSKVKSGRSNFIVKK